MSQIETIDELFATNNPEIWKTYLPLFIDLYVQKSAITALGVVLTRDNIPALMSEMVSDKAARTWVELWQESTIQYKEFEIPMSLLNAAVRYKETKGDRRALMVLPQELRGLLQPLVASQLPKN
ncbi:hypothetical protein QUA70_25230 [Microcoleus sp. LAD1_D5]|uniref:hypothetical protein n=1 Tax=unclassified Microcoleus TaxID=2642155 RepID=UPI002FD53076